jgi:hypothetical protein
MHARNGRLLHNGDLIIQLGMDGAQAKAVGVLFDAQPGNDFCNGHIAPIQQPIHGACMCDCIHLDDLAELLKEKGLHKRPEG